MLRDDAGPERFKTPRMEIDRPRPKIVAPRERDLRAPHPRQQHAGRVVGRPHLTAELVRGDVRIDAAGVDLEPSRPRELRAHPKRPEDSKQREDVAAARDVFYRGAVGGKRRGRDDG